LPAEFGFDLVGIDGVAQVVAGAVLDKGDLAFIIFYWPVCFAGQGFADGIDDIDIFPLVIAADIVGLAWVAFFKHGPEGAAVIFNVEPVT